MAYFADPKGARAQEKEVWVREYRCGCVIASELAPQVCPFHGEGIYCQTMTVAARNEHVGWGGE